MTFRNRCQVRPHRPYPSHLLEALSPLEQNSHALTHILAINMFSVLFVDDDPILRKLFSRTVRTVAPEWTIREAANGETALQLVETENFDLIFMDMYMASVEKQLLGTETVVALRNNGVKCRICGLSANDKEMEFLRAGADVFTYKPFPCEARALTQELYRILYYEETKPEDELLGSSVSGSSMSKRSLSH